MPKRLVNMMLDSGAFGAWKRGIDLDLDKYIEYVKRHEHLLFSYVNMDVIPGSKGVMSGSQKEVEGSAQKSYENLQRMKRAGLSPIPVFHQGERFYWLERMLAEGELYIGISPYKSASSNVRFLMDWLDRCFTLVTNEHGQPLCRTHGFGVTDQNLLLRYPWFTCDSTSWAIGPAYGHVPVPVYVNGKPDYTRKHRRIVMSGIFQESGSQKFQFEGLGPLSQAIVRKYLKEEIGIDVVDARNDPNLRRVLNLKFVIRLMEETICERFQHRQSSVHLHVKTKLKPQGPWHVKVMFATNPQHGQYATIMTKTGANNRLISYWDCLNVKFEGDKLAGMVETGLLPGYRPILKPKPNWGNETYLISRRFQLLSRLREPNAEGRFHNADTKREEEK